MTSHEFDAYLDTLPDEHFEPPYHEQLLVLQEFEETREASLKQQGAIEALDALKDSINNTILAAHIGQEDMVSGLLHAKKEIEKALTGYTSVEASGKFPTGYFDGVQEALDSLTILKGGVL